MSGIGCMWRHGGRRCRDPMTRAKMLWRALVAFLAVLWSALPILLSGTAAIAVIFAIPSFLEHPSWAGAATFSIALFLAYTWLTFLVLTVGWVIDRQLRRFWVASGAACGSIAFVALLIWLPTAAAFALPSVLFAAYVSGFHLERSARGRRGT